MWLLQYVSANANATRFLVRGDKGASRLETNSDEQSFATVHFTSIIAHIGVLYMAMASSNSSYLAFLCYYIIYSMSVRQAPMIGMINSMQSSGSAIRMH